MAVKRRSILRTRISSCWKTGIPPLPLVYLGLITVQVGFGLYPVIVKKFVDQRPANPGANSEADPAATSLIFSFYRDSACFPVLMLCSWVGERKCLIPKPKDLLLFAVLGIVGMFGNQLLYILGVVFAGANSASIFQNAIPVWAAILATFTCMEKFRYNKWFTYAKMLGILAAAAGAVEMALTNPSPVPDGPSLNHTNSSTPSPTSAISEQTIGYLCLTANTACMAVYVILQKRFIFESKSSQWKQYPITVTAWSYGFGALAMGLASVYYYKQPEIYVLPDSAWYALVYAVFITSALCYLLLTWSNLHIASTVVTAFWPLQVPVTFLSSWLVLGALLGSWQYAGAGLIVIGLFLVVLANHQEGKLKKKLQHRTRDREEDPLLVDTTHSDISEELVIQ